MFKLIKIVIYMAAFIGLTLICVNGYDWYQTGKWGDVSMMELIGRITGSEIKAPETSPDRLQEWIGR